MEISLINRLWSKSQPTQFQNTAKLTVVNGNANKDAGPLVLYAFDGRHSGECSLEKLFLRFLPFIG